MLHDDEFFLHFSDCFPDYFLDRFLNFWGMKLLSLYLLIFITMIYTS